MLVGIVGMNGAGKEEVGRYLQERYGFSHKDLGQEVRDELKRMGKDHLDRKEMDNLGNGRRKLFGPNYWCNRAIGSMNSDNMVITSLRNVAEVEEIISRKGIIIEVFADLKTRYDRTTERVNRDPNAHGDVKSFEYFKEREEANLRSEDPTKMQLLECIKLAQYRIDNNGTVLELHSRIDALIGNLMEMEVSRESGQVPLSKA